MWFDKKGIAALDTEPADLSTFHSPALAAQDQTEDDVSQASNIDLSEMHDAPESAPASPAGMVGVELQDIVTDDAGAQLPGSPAVPNTVHTAVSEERPNKDSVLGTLQTANQAS